jgi:hypothetical protein
METVGGKGYPLDILAGHLIHQHGWTQFQGPGQFQAKTAIYYWRIYYLSHCLDILKSSSTKGQYLAEVSLVAPFNPLVFPPGYYDNGISSYRSSTAMYWKGEYERIAREWIKDSLVPRFEGISLDIRLTLA